MSECKYENVSLAIEPFLFFYRIPILGVVNKYHLSCSIAACKLAIKLHSALRILLGRVCLPRGDSPWLLHFPLQWSAEEQQMTAGTIFLMQSGEGLRCTKMKVMEEFSWDTTLVPRGPE